MESLTGVHSRSLWKVDEKAALAFVCLQIEEKASFIVVVVVVVPTFDLVLYMAKMVVSKWNNQFPKSIIFSVWKSF